MVKFYVTKINRGQITIDDVPTRWRAKVQAELDKQKAKN